MQNYFELFSLKVDFSINLTQLENLYQQQIAKFHPDKFVTQSEQKKIIALQNSSLINAAYATLKSPLKRATYLLELSNINAFDEKDTQMDEGFLLSQIEYREALEQLETDKNIDEIEIFIAKMATLKQQYITNIATNFSENNLAKIKNLVRELRFFQQLQADANKLLDEL